MGEISYFHWLILLSMMLIYIVPLWLILPRAGIPSWVAIFAFFPLVAIILLWIMAFKTWPGDEKAKQ
jgi:hypothetical protein